MNQDMLLGFVVSASLCGLVGYAYALPVWLVAWLIWRPEPDAPADAVKRVLGRAFGGLPDAGGCNCSDALSI